MLPELLMTLLIRPMSIRAGLLALAALATLPAGCGADNRGLGDKITGGGGAGGGPGPDPEREDAGEPGPMADAAAPKLDGQPDGNIAPPPDMQPRADVGPCSFGRITMRKATPEVLLLFDRSSAMSKVVMPTMQTRWNEMTAGIDDNLRKMNAGVQWGLKFVPTTNTMCDVADGVEVAVGAMNYDSIITRIRGTTPIAGPEGSPLHAGVRKATVALTSRLPATTNPKFLVLATDGTSSCPVGDPGDRESVRAVEGAAAQGIRTFVLGTTTAGTAQDRNLNNLAAAGREGAATEPRYHRVQARTEVLTALDKITSRLTSCVWTTNVPPAAPDFTKLEIDGKTIPRDQSQREGWNWAGGGNQHVVHVYGAACEALKAGPPQRFEMIYGCPGIAPP
jgi:hypothetical protein